MVALIALLVATAPAPLPASVSDDVRIRLNPLPGAHVGRVDGTRAFIAVSLQNGRLRVYICDGTLRRDPTISTWFRSRWGGRKALTLHSDGHTLRLRPVAQDGSIAGRLDRAHRFRVKPAHTPAGLFKGRKGRLRTTWVVLPGLHKRGTFIPTRPPRCRVVLVSTSSGSTWVTVCG
jgi:hypothetical protein